MTSEGLRPEDPTRLGEYWLAGRLGAGGQGVVYEAYDPSGRRVAIKVLHGDAARDPELRDRFGREVASARRVASFCIAQVIDAALDAPQPYIVSEYIQGPSLRRAVAEGRTFAGDDLHRLATAVATAIAAIHDAGVVHRDLKPDNVLLGPDGPRVIDFGIARTLEMSLTATGLVTGTPIYMAPEVFTGERAGPPADVFAWGGIMLFAATGADPFKAESLGGVMHRVLSEEPALDVLPRSVRPLVSAALSKDPLARPTARDLLYGLISGVAPGTDLLAAGTAEGGLLSPRSGRDPGLGMVAEEAHSLLDAAQREFVPEVFLRLVTVGDDGEIRARRMPRAELLEGRPEQEAEAVTRVLQVFAYLLTGRGDEIGLARPALIQAWPRLRAWVQAEREGLAVLRDITAAARRWNRGGDGDLFQGDRLDAALRWAATARRHLRLTRLERDFLDAGSALARRRAGRRRVLAVTLAVLLVLSVGFGAATVWQSINVGEQRDLAESRSIASTADGLRDTDPVKAMLLSAAAWRLGPTVEARAALLSSFAQRERAVLTLGGAASALSRDGRTAASADGEDDRVTIWDTRSGKRTGGWAGLGIRGQRLHSIALSHDGGLLAVAAGSWVRVWDVRTGKATGRKLALGSNLFEGHYPIQIAFGAAPRVLIVGFAEAVRLWNIDTGVAGHKQLGYLADVDPSGRVAAIDGVGERPRLFDQPGTTPRATPKGICGGPVPTWMDDGAGPQALAFGPGGRTLACFADQGLTLTDLTKGVTGVPFGTAASGAPEVIFSADGRFLAARGADSIMLWRVSDQTLLLTLPTAAEATQVRFDADGRSLRYILDDTVHTVEIGDLVGKVAGLPGDYAGVVTPDGKLVADDARLPGTLTFRDVGTGRASGSPVRFKQTLEDISFSRDQRVVAVVDDSGRRMWALDRVNGRRLATTSVPQRDGWSVHGTAVTADGSRAVAVVATPTAAEVRLGDLKAGGWRVVARLDDTDASTAAFAPDGRTLAVLGARAGYLVDVDSGKVRTFAASGQQLMTVAFHPAKPLLVTGDFSGRLMLWDTRTGARLGPALHADVRPVERLAFSADGATLAAAGDRSVQLWDLATAKALGEPVVSSGANVRSVAFGPGGSYLAVLDEQGGVRLTPLAPDALVKAVCGRAGRTLTVREWQEYLPRVAYIDVCAGTS
ncbi:WD40 repeat domain-containing serine/threonine protein kinase [Sphaerisporangium fuscum]|uniref:WD40 repeat domain-containing serine/threonine protein kinase n=1 Tax=Sphaerisporangium fuscum TaxID=2835868 RepID=UPI001BDC6F91|nr:serine/threonine-protein kinase [Sphaerisporangium fuscum]